MPGETEIQNIRQDYRWLYPLLTGGFLIAVGIAIGAVFFGSHPIFEGNILSYSANLWTEAISIAITVTILDQLNRRRDEFNKVEELKERLLREACSTVNSVAIQAINEIRARQLTVTDSLLKGASLNKANLANCDLQDTNLTGTNFGGANLKGANLFKSVLKEANLWSARLDYAILSNANLQSASMLATRLRKADLRGANLSLADLAQAKGNQADFSGANLTDARLERADFSGANLGSAKLIRAKLPSARFKDADLSSANLEEALLESTDFSGADFGNANLKGAIFKDTIFSNETALPDANIIGINKDKSLKYDKYWTPETDMSRYTDPDHPDFWQPTWAIEIPEQD